jgi:excisionase family DNA binding protein
MIDPIDNGKPLTTGDVARYCHVSQVGVLKWIKNGKLKAYSTPGGHYRIQRQEFREFLQQYKMPVDERFFSGHDKRILVIEHDPKERASIFQALLADSTQYSCASASDGFEAGRQVAAFKPDVIILDLMLPGIDTFELCRQIKSNPETEHIRILGVTERTKSDLIERLTASGAEGCLTKPLRPETLKSNVRKLLGFTKRQDDA